MFTQASTVNLHVAETIPINVPTRTHSPLSPSDGWLNVLSRGWKNANDDENIANENLIPVCNSLPWLS